MASLHEVDSMNRRQTDTVVGFLVIGVLFVGAALSWQAYQQQQALGQMDSMMGTSMGAVHGTNPLWYILGTVVVSVVIAGGYLSLRDDLQQTGVSDSSATEPSQLENREFDSSENGDSGEGGAVGQPAKPERRVLDLLPDDERRVLDPVLTSPGITQIELRDRSDFSKSKVSQTVSSLEKRGLLYREKQGRTYRIYPSEDLEE